MSSITQKHQQFVNTWNVYRKTDAFGTGYIAQDSQFDTEARADGWELMFSGCHPQTAIDLRDTYKSAGQPEATQTVNLDDLLIFDMTEEADEREAETVSEFDWIEFELNGAMVDGIITYIDFEQEIIEIDGYLTVDMQSAMETGRLIAAAESDCGFIQEFRAWLEAGRKNMERLYAVAVQADSQVA